MAVPRCQCWLCQHENYIIGFGLGVAAMYGAAMLGYFVFG